MKNHVSVAKFILHCIFVGRLLLDPNYAFIASKFPCQSAFLTVKLYLIQVKKSFSADRSTRFAILMVLSVAVNTCQYSSVSDRMAVGVLCFFCVLSCVVV